jgi:hypothetical protein
LDTGYNDELDEDTSSNSNTDAGLNNKSSTSLPTIATMTTTKEKEEEPVIQNGTLAAASALMTLFGERERSIK